MSEINDFSEFETIPTVHPLLKGTCTRLWTEGFQNSPIPIILLDRDLNIIWSNRKFMALFGDPKTYLDTPLREFFRESLDDIMYKSILENINSWHASYSWKGRIEKKGVLTTSIISNLLLLPVFHSPCDIRDPRGFACLLDNVSEEFKQILKMTFLSLLEASRLKDNDTGNHIKRVNVYSHVLAACLQSGYYKTEIDSDFIENIGFLAAMHDVGKIGTPDDILNKEGPLEAWEREIIEEHTINGAYILNSYPNPMAKSIAMSHHEKWDGTGYPYHFSRTMIPLCARIVAVADVYDALRMKRSYKPAFSHEKAREIIKSESGKHFDPVIVEQFLDCEERFDQIYTDLQDNNGNEIN